MDETNLQLPLIPQAVLDYLEKTFPDRLPTREVSPFALGYEVGTQRVIQHLRKVKQWGEEKDVQD